jgi:hypothetical protein
MEIQKFFPDAKGHCPEADISRLVLPGTRGILSGVSHSALRVQEGRQPILVSCRAHSNESLFHVGI